MSAGSGSIISTAPPRALSRPAITSAILSSPSRSPLPDSIATRSLRVSMRGAFSLAASERTGSTGAAVADAVTARQTLQAARAARRKWVLGRVAMADSGSLGKAEIYPKAIGVANRAAGREVLPVITSPHGRDLKGSMRRYLVGTRGSRRAVQTSKQAWPGD